MSAEDRFWHRVIQLGEYIANRGNSFTWISRKAFFVWSPGNLRGAAITRRIGNISLEDLEETWT